MDIVGIGFHNAQQFSHQSVFPIIYLLNKQKNPFNFFFYFFFLLIGCFFNQFSAQRVASPVARPKAARAHRPADAAPALAAPTTPTTPKATRVAHGRAHGVVGGPRGRFGGELALAHRLDALVEAGKRALPAQRVGQL